MYAYRFDGYWRDVGTILSLWEANMDLLGENPPLNLNDETWRIYARHGARTPQFIGKNAKVELSSITEGCEIEGCVENSVLGAGVRIYAGATVSHSVLMDGVTVESGATVSYAILAEGVRIGANCRIGKDQIRAREIAVVGAGIYVPSGMQIGEGGMISSLKDMEEEDA